MTNASAAALCPERRVWRCITFHNIYAQLRGNVVIDGVRLDGSKTRNETNISTLAKFATVQSAPPQDPPGPVFTVDLKILLTMHFQFGGKSWYDSHKTCYEAMKVAKVASSCTILNKCIAEPSLSISAHAFLFLAQRRCGFSPIGCQQRFSDLLS